MNRRDYLPLWLVAILFSFGASAFAGLPANVPSDVPIKVPGIVVAHSPKGSGIYIGSPSLAVMPDGSYIASHDCFGPKSTENSLAVTKIFRSKDRGNTWEEIAKLHGQFWSTLFLHRDALYIIGTTKGYGNVVIRRSTDGGTTWTEPKTSGMGLLLGNGQYHCAPVPVVEHDGRLWRAFERRDPPNGWAMHFCAGMLSCPVDADLLDAANWRASNFLPGDKQWPDFHGWLEGNTVITPEGNIVDILRVDTLHLPEKAAIVNISSHGETASFDSNTGLVEFPGGAKKFTIRKDPRTNGYWTLASIVSSNLMQKNSSRLPTEPGKIRNTLALLFSPDLHHWETRCILLHHPDPLDHAFQYVDWLFDGPDIIAVSRTAYDDGEGGANRYHDANYLTFHRFTNFRNLTDTLANH